ncbi:MAG: phytoene desaturase [Pseudomonadota bacterium]
MNQIQVEESVINKAHAVVIGSGFGGLAAAIRLGARGYRVTVLEKLDAPGGRAYVDHRDGYIFDRGPTIVTAPFVFEELWTLCGKKLEDDVTLKPMDPFYQIRFDDGRMFNYSADLDAMREEVKKFNPDDVNSFDRFIKLSGEIYQIAFAELAAVPFHSFLFTLSTAPDLVRLGGHNTVYKTVCSYFSDPALRIVFSFHPLLIGGNPMTTTAYYCLIAHLERKYGVHYAMGGMGALAQGMIKLIDQLQGNLICNAEVKRILSDAGKATGVELKNGERITADIVVSNADSAWTYKHLMGDHKPRRWTEKKIKRSRFSMSLFVWFFGTNRRYDDVYHHLILLGPRYEGLLKDIFKHKNLATDFSLYLHRPTATDASLAPTGHDTFYVLSPVPHLESGVDWEQQGESYRLAIQKRLEETVLPGLSESLTTSYFTTPMDFETRLNSVNGAAFGLEPQLLQSAWFRPHNKSEELENLFLVGAGTHPGAGVPGVISSAKILDEIAPSPDSFVP